jgi:predicted transcriptional regulator
MKYTSINYAQLKKYLGPLTRIGLVDMDVREGKALYRASEKGLAFLRQYSILRGMLL